MSCFFLCVSKTVDDVILIPNHNVDIQKEPDVKEDIQKIMENIQNYTPLSEEQLLLLETFDIKKIIEIIKIQNNCLDTLSALMT